MRNIMKYGSCACASYKMRYLVLYYLDQIFALLCCGGFVIQIPKGSSLVLQQAFRVAVQM